MLNIIAGMLIKNHYGDFRMLQVTQHDNVFTGTFLIKARSDYRWAGSLTQKRQAILEQWVIDGRIKKIQEVLLSHDAIQYTFAWSDKAWTWRELLKVRRFLKPATLEDGFPYRMLTTD